MNLQVTNPNYLNLFVANLFQSKKYLFEFLLTLKKIKMNFEKINKNHRQEAILQFIHLVRYFLVFICLFVYLFICLFVFYLFICCLFVYLFTYLLIYLPTN